MGIVVQVNGNSLINIRNEKVHLSLNLVSVIVRKIADNLVEKLIEETTNKTNSNMNVPTFGVKKELIKGKVVISIKIINILVHFNKKNEQNNAVIADNVIVEVVFCIVKVEAFTENKILLVRDIKLFKVMYLNSKNNTDSLLNLKRINVIEISDFYRKVRVLYFNFRKRFRENVRIDKNLINLVKV